jgi:hypothetical protein
VGQTWLVPYVGCLVVEDTGKKDVTASMQLASGLNRRISDNLARDTADTP